MPENLPRIRVVIAKVGLDGHDRGAKVVARALRDAGMEVIYTGLRQTPEAVAHAVVQEDAGFLGISLLSGAHLGLIPRVMDALRAAGAGDVDVLVGGIIPEEDVTPLTASGVRRVFHPGTPLDDIVAFVRNRWEERHRGAIA